MARLPTPGGDSGNWGAMPKVSTAVSKVDMLGLGRMASLTQLRRLGSGLGL